MLDGLLENISKVRVKIGYWRLQAEQILPLSEFAEEKISERTAFTERRYIWDVVAGKDDGEFEKEHFNVILDPGETDYVIGNLIIPASVQVVQVYSHFRLSKEQKWPAWPSISLVDLKIDQQEMEVSNEKD
jgi:hypothetical protein